MMDNENNPLHPNIGGVVFINPGSGPVLEATEANAIANMEVFCQDSPLRDLAWGRFKDADYGDGRFAFMVIWKYEAIEIQMPGWPLEQVRFTGASDQNIWNYPRLYVDGSSWVWQYAVPQYWDFYDEDEWDYNPETNQITPKHAYQDEIPDTDIPWSANQVSQS